MLPYFLQKSRQTARSSNIEALILRSQEGVCKKRIMDPQAVKVAVSESQPAKQGKTSRPVDFAKGPFD